MEAGDDGRIRTGTMWSAAAHAITASVGSGILALPWSVAQLGWIVGLFVLIFFALVTYYTAILLCDCYRAPDPIHGRRNHNYMTAVKAFLGTRAQVICGMAQYSILWGTMIGYSITTAISIAGVRRSTCFHEKGHDAECGTAGNIYLISYGALEMILSQCPNLEKVTLLSVVAAVTAFAYSLISLGLTAAKFSQNHKVRGSLMVAKIGKDVASSTKVWHAFQALGNIAFAYTYSMLLLEIQDTLKSPPPENKVMKKVTLYAVSITSTFYICLGCMGFAAFGSDAPGNVLAGFYEPYWLVNIGNLAIIVHLIGAYQVFAQPVFAVHEKLLSSKWPTTPFFNRNYTLRFLGMNRFSFHFTMSKLILRPIFVLFTTAVAMTFPFFDAILGLLGACSFWPLTVYLPVQMYMVQAKIKRGSFNWIALQILSMVCLVITFAAAIGSIADILENLKHAKLFHIEL